VDVVERTAELKRKAGERAVDFVTSGMVVGLGHGSTAIFALRRIAALLAGGDLQDVLGIPTSTQVARDARELGIPLTTLNEHPQIDLTIDGADEVDDDLNLIKGGGGALLREKIVAQASRREVIVVDETKLSPTLGVQWPVPVEVTPFGWRSQEAFLSSLGARVTLRCTEDGSPFKTDQGNLVLDCDFGALSSPMSLATRLNGRAGILEHGLFLGLVSDLIIGKEDGTQHVRAAVDRR
jgi:ribose 5-phosphate isomerase A